MPRFEITDTASGRTLVVEGEVPPNEQDAADLFQEHKRTTRAAELEKDLPRLPTEEEMGYLSPEAMEAMAGAHTLSRLALTKGGKVGDMAARTLAPIGAAIAGTVAGGPAGTVAAGGLAGLAGEELAQKREYYRGERDEGSTGQKVAAVISGGIPVAGRFLATPLKIAGIRAAQGAGIGAVSNATGQVIDKGEIELKELAISTGLGGLFGAGAGAVEGKLLQREVLKKLRDHPTFKEFEGTDAELKAAAYAELKRRQGTAPSPEPAAPPPAEPINVTPSADPMAAANAGDVGPPPAAPITAQTAEAEMLARMKAAGFETTLQPTAATAPAAQAVTATAAPIALLPEAPGLPETVGRPEQTAAVDTSSMPAPVEQPAPTQVNPSANTESFESTPQVAGDESNVIEVPPDKPKGLTLKYAPRSDGVVDIIDAIHDVGLVPRRPEGETGGEWDGHEEVFGGWTTRDGERKYIMGSARLLAGNKAGGIDQYLQDLTSSYPQFEHLVSDPDGFRQAVAAALTERSKLKVRDKMERQTGIFQRAALERKGGDPVPLEQVKVGDEFEVLKSPVRVIGIDPENGSVTVQDGPRFGTQTLPAEGALKVDRGSFKPAVDGAPAGDAPFEDATPYANAHTQWNQLRSLEKQGKLTPQGQAQLEAVERSLGQDFIEFYQAEKPGALTTPAEKQAENAMELAQRQAARLQAGGLESQVDLFGPASDKKGQFELFEGVTQRYLDARHVTSPGARVAVRGLLEGVWERRNSRQLELDFATDRRLGDTLPAAAVDYPASPAPGQLGGPVPSQPRTEVGNDGMVRSRSGLRLDSIAFTNQFLRDGYVQLVGRAFKSTEEFVAAAQILRNREVETFWIFPQDAEGKMLAPYAVTSRLPNTVSVGNVPDYVRSINRHLRDVGAASYAMVHNHPSGDPHPSSADVRFTRHLAQGITAAKFRSHEVINHGKFASIDSSGNVTRGEIPAILSQPDPTAQATGQFSPYLGRQIGADLMSVAQQRMIRLGYELQNPDGNILIMLPGSKGTINGIVSLTPADLNHPAFFNDLREAAQRASGIVGVAYYEGGDPAVRRQLTAYVNSGHLFHAAFKENGKITLAGGTYDQNKFFGASHAHFSSERIAEDGVEYSPDAAVLFTEDDGKTTPMALAQLDKVPAVEMPELVEIVKQLAGDFPKLKQLAKSRGYMKGAGKGSVVLDRRIFSDPVAAARTLAHELGHLVDYLDDQTLKRGNLLGRLAVLRSFGKDVFGPAIATNKQLREEGKALSAWWRPWDEATASASFAAYRNSASEIYADGLSVLFNAPQELKARAPQFWNEFFRFIEKKPEVKAQLFATWDVIHQGAHSVSAQRAGNLRAGFARAEEILLAKSAERAARRNSLPAIVDGWKQKHYNLYAPIVDKARAAKAAGAEMPWHRDPEYVFDAHPLAENDNYRFIDRVNKQVSAPLAAAGLDESQLGDFLFYNRLVHEAYEVNGERAGRTVIANPLGHTPATARRELLVMRYQLGPARFEQLQAAARQFQDLAFEVLENGWKRGIYSTENYQRAKENRYNYATFAVVDFLEQSPHIPAGIRQQSGTLREIANPFVATVLKMLTANKLAEHNNAKRVAVKLLADHFPDEIAQAKVKRIGMSGGGVMTRPLPPPAGKAELVVLENGKPATWHVEPEMARMFEHRTPASAHSIVGVLNWTFRNLFYPAFITYNPAFQLYSNPLRDARRSYVNLPPGVQRRHFAGEQIRSGVTARARMLNDVSAEQMGRKRTLEQLRAHQNGRLTDIQQKELDLLNRRALAIEMLATRAISTPFESFAVNPGRTDAWGAMLTDYRMLADEKKGNWLRDHAGKLGPLLDKLEKAGLVLEGMPKTAAYRVLTRELGWSAPMAAEYVRNHVGTPNFMRRGQWAAMDGTIFPFINIFMQGLSADLRQARGLALGPVAAGKQRFEWWRRMSEGTLVPRLLQALAAAGVLGVGLKALYDGITDYNKSNYLVIPLGAVKEGEFGSKTVALRLPEDETARLLGGLIHYTVQAAFNGDPRAKASLGDLSNYMGGQVPGVNPLIKIGNGWAQYSAGINPRDNFRGNTIMTATDFNAGGWPRLRGMMAWTWNETGGGNFVRWDPHAQTAGEIAISSTPGLNRLLLVTDAGHREMQQQGMRNYEEQNAKIRAVMPPVVNSLLHEYAGLNALRPEMRTPPQQFRYMELQLWHSKVWEPNYRQMQEQAASTWRTTGTAVGQISEAFKPLR